VIAFSALLPTWLDLGGLMGILFAGAVLMLSGRVLTGGNAPPEFELVAGWGFYALVLTLWGVATAASMLIPTACFIGLALAALVLRRFRPPRKNWTGIARILVLALPIWAIMAAVKPALPDTFTNFLPNAVYLYDHGFFPADDRAHAFAIWPAFPYNAQLATYLATIWLPDFPPSALTLFNILLQIMFGLFLARMLQRPKDPFAATPSWAECAGGLLLATALNPGFVPRIDFTSYAEPELTVAVALLGWLGIRILGKTAARQPSGGDLRLFALVLVALVGIKQVGIVLGVGVVACLGVLALADRRIARGPALATIAASCVPALVLWGAWRGYVLSHFVSGELKLLPPSMWDFTILPATLASMAQEIAAKPIYFGIVAIVVGLAVRLTRRDGLTERSRLLLLIIGLFLIYNAFLILIYVISMGPVAGEAAHSYFRYMTHLSLLIVLALTLIVREWWAAHASDRGLATWRRLAPPIAIAVALLVPVVFVKRLRFDLQMPQPLIWDLARNVAEQLNDGDKLALLLPGDNGSDSEMLRAALELTPPRRRNLDTYDVSEIEDGLKAAVERGYTWALVSCVPSAETPEAALMSYDGTVWRINASWPYPPVKTKERWTTVLTAGPLCHKE
jgi:hypothetical protein